MAEKPFLPTIDDMLNLPEPSDAHISPDGQYIAYTLSGPDWEQNERIRQRMWGEQVAHEQEKTAFITLVEGISQPEVESVPAIRRYQGKHVQQLYRQAAREDANFYIFSGECGLMDAEFPAPPEERPLSVGDISAMVVNITETLRDAGIGRVVFHSPPAEKDPWVLLYLGCLYAAAGLAGKVKVEHVEFEP